MRCPFCRHIDSRVVDSRTTDDGTAIRRRRQCPECGRRFTTLETSSLLVIKRSGATEPFSREKVLAGVRKACQGRQVSEDELARLDKGGEEESRGRGGAEVQADGVGEAVEGSIPATGLAKVPANEFGLAILGPLRELDDVAFLRFASVYRGFDSLEDFEKEIAKLRADGHDRSAVPEHGK